MCVKERIGERERGGERDWERESEIHTHIGYYHYHHPIATVQMQLWQSPKPRGTCGECLRNTCRTGGSEYLSASFLHISHPFHSQDWGNVEGRLQHQPKTCGVDAEWVANCYRTGTEWILNGYRIDVKSPPRGTGDMLMLQPFHYLSEYATRVVPNLAACAKGLRYGEEGCSMSNFLVYFLWSSPGSAYPWWNGWGMDLG